MTDPGHDRVIHGGMTQRAGDAKPRDAIVGVHRGLESDDGVHRQHGDRGRRTPEIDCLEDAGWERVRVHLEPHLQRRGRVHNIRLCNVKCPSRRSVDAVVRSFLITILCLLLTDELPSASAGAHPRPHRAGLAVARFV
jgi:hypothetical protein